MFEPQRILYEDNHLMVVNKRAGELVQPDPSGILLSKMRSKRLFEYGIISLVMCFWALCIVLTGQ